MNTIFLDIDGVLSINISGRVICDAHIIDADKIALLTKLVKYTDAQIVLHSGWKYWFGDKLNPIRKESVQKVYANELNEMKNKLYMEFENVD